MSGRRRYALAALGAAVVVAAGAVTAFSMQGNGQPAAASSPAVRAGNADPTTTTTAPPALEMLSSSPASGAAAVNGAGPFVITTNQPVELSAVQPSVSPAIPGQWSSQGDRLTFTPAGAFPPDATVSIGIPAGLRAKSGATLGSPRTVTFRTESGSILGLQEDLAGLGYLPLHFTPASQAPDTLAARQRAAFDPAPGTFSWAFPAVPPSLAATWVQGQYTVLIRGAVMSFEADHGLAVDGIAGPEVWRALTSSTTPNAHGYTYALASQTLPETLTVWHNGAVISQSPANTGIPQAPTANGTFPVYERLATQVMKGTNPNGTHYADPVAWVAYFNGGDAIHYIARSSYGYPQSLGCVEVAYGVGKTVWPYLTLGTLVTVTG